MAEDSFWLLGDAFLVDRDGNFIFDDHCCCESDSESWPRHPGMANLPMLGTYDCERGHGEFSDLPLIGYVIPVLARGTGGGPAVPLWEIVGDSDSVVDLSYSDVVLELRPAVYCPGNFEAFVEKEFYAEYITRGSATWYNVGVGAWLPEAVPWESGTSYIGDRYDEGTTQWIHSVVGTSGDGIVSVTFSLSGVTDVEQLPEGGCRLHVSRRKEVSGNLRRRTFHSPAMRVAVQTPDGYFGNCRIGRTADSSNDGLSRYVTLKAGYMVGYVGGDYGGAGYTIGCHSYATPGQACNMMSGITPVAQDAYVDYLMSPLFQYFVSITTSFEVGGGGTEYTTALAGSGSRISHTKHVLVYASVACRARYKFAWMARVASCPFTIQAMTTGIETGSGPGAFDWPIPAEPTDGSINYGGIFYAVPRNVAPPEGYAAWYYANISEEGSPGAAWQNTTTHQVVATQAGGGMYGLAGADMTEEEALASTHTYVPMSGEAFGGLDVLGSSGGRVDISVFIMWAYFFPEEYNACRPAPFLPRVPDFDMDWLNAEDARNHHNTWRYIKGEQWRDEPSTYYEPCGDCSDSIARAALSRLIKYHWSPYLARPMFSGQYDPWFMPGYVVRVEKELEAERVESWNSEETARYMIRYSDFCDTKGCSLSQAALILACEVRHWQHWTVPGADPDRSSSSVELEWSGSYAYTFGTAGGLKVGNPWTDAPTSDALYLTVPRPRTYTTEGGVTHSYSFVHPPTGFLLSYRMPCRYEGIPANPGQLP